MRMGWNCNDAAAVLNVSPTRVTQALDPALRKLALLYRISAHKTMIAILAALDDLEPMTEVESRLCMEMVRLKAHTAAPPTTKQSRAALLRSA